VYASLTTDEDNDDDDNEDDDDHLQSVREGHLTKIQRTHQLRLMKMTIIIIWGASVKTTAARPSGHKNTAHVSYD